MLNKSILSKIRKLAFQIDWDIAFNGKSKGNKHLFRIVKIAKFLAKKTGANLFIVEAGALLHDTALPFGNDSNYKHTKKRAINLLQRFNLTQSELDKIADCVASHEGTVKPKTLEAKVVHDADVLEKSSILGIIRHTWKLVNLKKINGDKITNKEVKEILQHLKWRRARLQITISKELSQRLDANLDTDQVKKIIQKTAKLAEEAIVTEKIVTALYKQLNSNQLSILKSQLDLKYLQ